MWQYKCFMSELYPGHSTASPSMATLRILLRQTGQQENSRSFVALPAHWQNTNNFALIYVQKWGLLLFILGLPISAGRIYLQQQRLWPPCCCCVAELSVLIFNWEERGRDTIMSIIGTRYKYHQYTAHGVNTGHTFDADAHSMLNVSPYLSVINQSEL